MNTHKIAISLFAAGALTISANADGGELHLNMPGANQTTEYKALYSGITANPTLGNIRYISTIQNPVSVSDASFQFDFSDTNITDAMLTGTRIQDMNSTDLSTFVASYESMTSGNIAVYKKLNNDTGVVNTERNFIIQAKESNGTIIGSTIEYGFVNGGDSVSVEVWSASGTAKKRDSATFTVTPSNTTPQFKFSCVGKYDALINFENNGDTFVATGHGHADEKSQDTVVFEINNADTPTYSVDGNATEIIISADDVNLSSLGFVAADFNLTGKDKDGNIHAGTATLVAPSDIHFTITNKIPSGLSTWYATIADTNVTTAKATKFTMKSINLEGNTTAHPSIEYTAITEAGEWKRHAFIAQIPGATQTTTTQTKLFIVNRSCAAVIPKFKLIKDGTVSMVDGTSIAVDTQQKVTLATLITKANDEGASPQLENGRYAVEIILPGIAEDFYVYAQAQGVLSTSITKDLPVYNTSVRD